MHGFKKKHAAKKLAGERTKVSTSNALDSKTKQVSFPGKQSRQTPMKGSRTNRIRLPRWVWKGFGLLLVAGCCSLGFSGFRINGGVPELSPSEFKTVFLKNVLLFATWPGSAFEGTNTNIVICVLGPDPFEGLLEKITTDHQVGGRSIQVKMDADLETIQHCQLLYVPANQQSNWLRIQKKLGESGIVGILTVGEDPEFLASGGIIKILPEKRVFDLHLAHANAQGDRLRLNPKLKSAAAHIVR